MKFKHCNPILLSALLSLPVISLGQGNYAAFELARAENFEPLYTEDFDGDGRKDIIVPFYSAAVGRELHIHYQQADGGFRNQPQRIEIKSEIIAVGFADLRPEPGLELVLLANNGVFSLSTQIEGYVGNLQPIQQWDLIASMPNLERVQFIDALPDINADGHADLLLPGQEEYLLLTGNEAGEFNALSRFSTINQNLTQLQRRNRDAEMDANLGINAEDGIVIRVNRQAPTPYQGFVSSWREEKVPDALLNSESWMPNAYFAQLNNDELGDLAYINVGDDGYGQLNIHYQDTTGGFAAEADWTGSIDTSGSLRLEDMDDDGLEDLLRLDGDGNEWEAHLYRNTGGQFDLESPQQVMRFSGYDVRIEFIKLTADSNPVMSVSYYTIPVVEAIRSASINRVQLLYSTDSQSDQLFTRRPTSRLEESFSADNVRGLSEQMSLRYDVDGDGRNDALYITANGTLAAKSVGEDLRIADEPFWEYVSPRTVFEFEVLQLNEDAIPDILLRHGTVTTLLVGLP